MMIYAPADMDPCIPINTLSNAHKHYKTHTNLCPTAVSSLETICNRQTAYDPQYFHIPDLDLKHSGASLPKSTELQSAPPVKAWLKYFYLAGNKTGV